MHSTGINREGELRGQPTNPGSPGNMAVKTVCMCVMMMFCLGNNVKSAQRDGNTVRWL